MSGFLSGRTSLTSVATENLEDGAVTTAKIADVNVSTGKVADDAVTLAKMAPGTDGNLITYDASGNPAAVATGSSTNVLTSNGAGAAPTFQAAAAGGAWTLIGTAVASNSASLTITGLSSTYDTYAIAFSDIIGATDDSNCKFMLGDSSGVDSGSSDYSQHVMTVKAGAAGYSDSEGVAFSGVDLSRNPGNVTDEGMGGLIYLVQPGDATSKPKITGNMVYQFTDGVVKGMGLIGMRNAVITVDRVHIIFNSGNITSGRMTVWGVSHA